MNTGRTWQNLRGKLFFRVLLGVLAISLPVIGASSLLLTRESGQKVEGDASSAAAVSAKAAAQRLDSWLLERKGDMQVVAQLVSTKLGDPAAANAQLRAVAGAYDAYDGIYVVDSGGGLIAASQADAKFDSAGRDWFAMAHTQPLITTVAVENGRLTWWVAEPLKNAAGQSVGVVAGDLKKSKLSDLLYNFDDDVHSELQVIDRDHHLLYSEAYGKINDNSELLAKFNLRTAVNSAPVDRALAGENGSTVYRNDQGDEVLAGYARPARQGWAVVTNEKTADALAAVSTQQGHALLFFLLAAAVLTLFSVAFARQVSRPILELSEVVATSATQLSSTSEELAATTTEQSAVVTETSSSMEELARTSYSIADTGCLHVIAPTRAPASLIRVVVADDSATLRLMLRSVLLTDGGFEIVGEAADGAEAVRVAVAEHPDVILLDVAMPILDGLEAIPLIAELVPETRIAVLSSFDAAHSEAAALGRGAHLYISKRATPVEVVAALRSICPANGEAPPAARPTGRGRGRGETLLQAEDRYQTSVQEVSDYGIFLLDPSGLVTSWNRGAQTMTGYTAAEIIGCHFSRFYPASDVAAGKPRRELVEAAATGRVEDEGWRVRQDGTQFRANVVINALHDPDGRLRGFAKVTRDVTDRWAAQEALVEANRALREKAEELARSNAELEQFARVASHDLQEPLRMVASYVQLLAKRYHGRLDEDADEYIGFAVEGATRMQSLIADLLAYSQAAQGPHELSWVAAEDCVSAARENLLGAINDSGATVAWGELPRLQADGTQLTQVLQNLIGNAIKFHGVSPPHVQIEARRDHDFWLFSVSDNGIGIDVGQRDRIFELFQRLHTREQFPGTGIGLGICKKVVERHGGRIWVDPAPGGGSTFQFTMPAQPAG